MNRKSVIQLVLLQVTDSFKSVTLGFVIVFAVHNILIRASADYLQPACLQYLIFLNLNKPHSKLVCVL